MKEKRAAEGGRVKQRARDETKNDGVGARDQAAAAGMGCDCNERSIQAVPFKNVSAETGAALLLLLLLVCLEKMSVSNTGFRFIISKRHRPLGEFSNPQLQLLLSLDIHNRNAVHKTKIKPVSKAPDVDSWYRTEL